MEKGLVLKSTGRHYKVLIGSDKIIDCTIRGKLRIKEYEITNPVAVGDSVIIENSGGTWVIREVLDRKNYILRKSSNLSRQSQIIAANIDQAFLMITIILPETPVEFIDRFLVTAEAYSVPVSILINKTDLYDEDATEKMIYLEKLYGKVGYECIRLSLKQNLNTDLVATRMRGNINLLSGNSGVGKTSLVNYLNPDLDLKTGEISDYHKQGKHITTFPEMHPLPNGGFVIDTPGLRGFGITDMQKNEIYHFFPEMFRISKKCRYYNCLHLDEPGCAVREAVENGEIDFLRYRSYLNIIEGDKKYR